MRNPLRRPREPTDHPCLVARFSQLILLSALVFSAQGGSALAQQSRAAYLVVGPDAAGDARFETLARAWAKRQAGEPSALAEEPARQATKTVSLDQLELLAEIEQALVEARELSAGLREAAAMRVLEAAESKLLAALDVPGAHAYLAEVYVQLGLCAAQLGEEGLAETALARAFSLDRTRRVEAAETPPATLALARQLARAHAARPDSETPLRITPSAALLWLDGVAQEAGASVLRATAGVHLLVARAPGYAPYAALVSLGPGRRAMLSIALSPLAAEQVRAALLAARNDVGTARRAATAVARSRGAAVYLLERARPSLRALVHRCTAEGCELVEGVNASGTGRARFGRAEDVRAWLAGGANSKPDAGVRRRRWPLWVAAAAALVASGAAAAVLATRDRTGRQQRELEIDPGTLPP